MTTSLDLSRILIPENRNIQDSVYEAMCGEIVWDVMTRANLAKKLSSMRNHLEGYAVKVAPELFGWLFNILQDVKKSLKIDSPIDLYIVNSPEYNAYSYNSVFPDETPIIVINSGLIEHFTPEELHFVIGHEIGHLIADHPTLNDVVDFLFNDEKPQPDILKRRLLLISQLSELEADRFGYIAMPDICACASTLFKLQSGVDPKFSHSEISKFLRLNKERVGYFLSADGTSALDHPADPIRIEALRLFSQIDNISAEDYSKAIYELYDVHTKLSESELDSNIGLFMAAGGLLISSIDGEISNQELNRICAVLSGYFMFPISIINQLMEDEEHLQETFEDSIQRILEIDASYKLPLIRYLAGFLVSDESICKDEIDFVIDCGTRLLGLSEEEVLEVIAQTLKADFVPSCTRIASVSSPDDPESTPESTPDE